MGRLGVVAADVIGAGGALEVTGVDGGCFHGWEYSRRDYEVQAQNYAKKIYGAGRRWGEIFKNPNKIKVFDFAKKLLGPLDNGARKQYISDVLRGMCPAVAKRRAS